MIAGQRVAATVLACACAPIALAACAAIAGLGDEPTREVGTTDGGGEAGLDADGSGDEAETSTGPDAPPAGCTLANVLYVSRAGSDANDGRTRTAPKATIGAAIDVVRRSVPDAAASGACVLVADGAYGENVLLDVPVSLYGGYDPGTWHRDALASVGLRTIVKGSAGPNCTLRATGATITRAVVVDGIEFDGSDETTSDACGAFVGVGASPVLTHDAFRGGSSTAGNAQAVIVFEGSPELAFDSIAGGRTSGSSAKWSAGLVLHAGQGDYTPSVHDNVIDGGTSASTNATLSIAAVGVYVVGGADLHMTLAAGNPFARNVVHGGTGDYEATTNGYAAVGIYDQGASGPIDFVDNTIDGGLGMLKGRQAGVLLGAGAVPVRIVGNRIFGGGRVQGQAPPQADVDAAVEVDLYTEVNVEITNNFLHAGSGQDGVAHLGLHFENTGVLTAARGGVVVRHNTIYAQAEGSARGADVYVGDQVVGVVLTNNAFVGNRDKVAAISTYACPAASIFDAIDNNLFFESSRGLLEEGYLADGTFLGGSCPGASTPDDLAKRGAGWTGNVSLDYDATCDAGNCIPGCVGTTADACLQGFFASWTTNGVAELVDGGWRLPPDGGAYCAYTRGGLDLTTPAGSGPDASPVMRDAYDASRTPPPSMGAEEVDGPCRAP